jgi:hypothetical protein
MHKSNGGGSDWEREGNLGDLGEKKEEQSKLSLKPPRVLDFGDQQWIFTPVAPEIKREEREEEEELVEEEVDRLQLRTMKGTPIVNSFSMYILRVCVLDR